MKKALMVALVCVGLVGLADAPAVTISQLEAHQRYPWNGKVDVSFSFTVTEPFTGGYVSLHVRDEDTGRDLPEQNFSLDGANIYAVAQGAHRIVWDSRESFSGKKNVSFRVSVSAFMPTGIIGDVASIELATGATTYFRQADIGQFNGSAYKTTHMAFRKILAGNYTVFCDERATNYVHTSNLINVSITTNYYLSIFELTRAQWLAMTGKDGIADSGNENQSENMMAPNGASTWVEYNHTNNLLGQYNARCSKTLRLPTEIEWEIAARAGTTSTYFWGEDASQAIEFCWTSANASGKAYEVGLKKPNPWGFYDILGNVAEFCLDGKTESTGWGDGVGYVTPYPESLQDPFVRFDYNDASHCPTEHYFRGGSYTEGAVKISNRRAVHRSIRNPAYGARLAFSAP